MRSGMMNKLSSEIQRDGRKGMECSFGFNMTTLALSKPEGHLFTEHAFKNPLPFPLESSVSVKGLCQT